MVKEELNFIKTDELWPKTKKSRIVLAICLNLLLVFTVIKNPFFPIKTASESQIKELMLNTERKPVDLAEIEKLIKEKNVAGSSKYRLEGIRIFFLDGNLSQSVWVVREKFDFIFYIFGDVFRFFLFFPLVLSLNNLKINKTWEVKNILHNKDYYFV